MKTNNPRHDALIEGWQAEVQNDKRWQLVDSCTVTVLVTSIYFLAGDNPYPVASAVSYGFLAIVGYVSMWMRMQKLKTLYCTINDVPLNTGGEE